MELQGALTGIDVTVIVVYLVSLVTIGLWVSFRRRGSQDLFLAGRSLGWPMVGLSIWGTNVGPSFLLGACGVAYSSGMVGANFEWLAWIFLMLLAMVFTPHYLTTDISTMPQFVRRRFGSASHTALATYTLISTLVLWLAGTLYAGGLLLSQMLSWPVEWSIVFLMIIATSFTALGGLAAVVVTDAFQVVLMILGSAVLTIIGLWHVGGFGELIDQVPSEYWKLIRSDNSQYPTEYPWYAMFLGYPVMGLWFWCTDQTIVQRVLGARDIRNGQLGAVFAGFLKILPPLIFMLPGVICFVLHPDLASPDEAYLTMVTEYLPVGMTGLMVAVLIAALVSTIDSGLNSFSTILTLDVYIERLRPNASPREIRRVGVVVTVGAAVFAVLCAMSMGGIGRGLFELLQGIIAFIAPPMAALFVVGIFWKRATAPAALATLVGGGVVSIGVGICKFAGFPDADFWPHDLLLSFLLFVGICLMMVVVSLGTAHSPDEEPLPSFRSAYEKQGVKTGLPWALWVILACLMVGIYGLFESLGRRPDPPGLGASFSPQGPWPSTVTVYRGTTPILDGLLSPGEWEDASPLVCCDGWNPQFSPVTDPADLAATVWIKHDGVDLYVAFDVSDDVLYGYDTDRYVPPEFAREFPHVHEPTREGFPWYGDGVELLINAEYRWSDEDEQNNKGNGHSWQLVCSTHKSILGGLGTPGLAGGEQRADEVAWETYLRWIREGAMEVAVRLKDAPVEGQGYVIEWRVAADPCLEVSPGVFWSPELGEVPMGLNLSVGDFDLLEAGAGNWGNFHHENWWAGEKDRRTWLKQWGTMIVEPGERP